MFIHHRSDDVNHRILSDEVVWRKPKAQEEAQPATVSDDDIPSTRAAPREAEAPQFPL